MKAIQIENLFFRYPNSPQPIFADFNWTVDRGDFWVIIGANGSGKTSLIRLLLGLEPIGGGSIAILGQRLQAAGLPAKPDRMQIGYVPQHLYADPRLPLPVLDVVKGGTLEHSFTHSLRQNLNMSRAQRKQRARQRLSVCLEALSLVGMEAHTAKRYSLLSGGQKQRVLIARALATQSPILILDEPTASTDPAATREIVQICQKLRKKHTILFISHDIRTIPEVCEYILCLNPLPPQSLLPASQNRSADQHAAHTHNVQNMGREQILPLLYQHWGLVDDKA